MDSTANSGISAIGELRWGAHFCHFYRTRADLVETLVPYFSEGLKARFRVILPRATGN